MPVTIDQQLRNATHNLAPSSPSPRLDAEVLLMHVTGLTRTSLITRAQELLSPENEKQLQALLTRRAHGEPVAYLTGKREFWSLDLDVTPEVLIPRTETELLVELALARIPEAAAWTIADLGTGSGAIALAIAKERPNCRVIATDISAPALAVARANAQRLGIANMEFRHGEWLTPFTDMRLDMILSNPPYIAAQDPHLTQSGIRFEPRSALVAGPDSMSALRVIACDAMRHLRTDGVLLLEHGFDQAQPVREVLVARGYLSVSTFSDLQGLPRVSIGIT